MQESESEDELAHSFLLGDPVSMQVVGENGVGTVNGVVIQEPQVGTFFLLHGSVGKWHFKSCAQEPPVSSHGLRGGAARHSTEQSLLEKKRVGQQTVRKMPRKCPSIRGLSFEDIVPNLHPGAAPQFHHVRTLLALLPRLDCQHFSLAVRRLHQSHPVEGAASVSWICSTMARRLPPKERKQMLERADRLMAESVGMRKIGKLWSSESAWEAVHGEPPRTLPRYHSAESFFLPFSNGPTSTGSTA